PLRLTQGLSDALPITERQLLDDLFERGLLGSWFGQLEWLDYYWSVWVLSFDQTEQLYLWQSLQSLPWVWATVILLSLLLLSLGGYLMLQRKVTNQNQRLRQLIVKVLKPYGEKAEYQSIESYLTGLMQSYPENQEKIRQLLNAYQHFEFAEQQEQLQHCYSLLRQLSATTIRSGAQYP
ncbi:hypothetical protein, partial [Rheinheimera sp.]|uniref:hypothetical protein n=1 Tax=Rheinheimera sp. TaxID=1869214 RepID=UPI0026351E54